MRCFLDCDGVLVDFVSGCMDVHPCLKGFYEKSENLGNWDLDKASGIPLDEFWSAFDVTFWESLAWMPDGKELLQWIEQKYGTENICLLTAPVKKRRADCMEGKFRWIRRELPQYEQKVLVGSYKEFCAHEGAILIDDNDKNVQRFQARGGQSFLVPRPWNSKHEHHHVALDYTKQHLAKK